MLDFSASTNSIVGKMRAWFLSGTPALSACRGKICRLVVLTIISMTESNVTTQRGHQDNEDERWVGRRGGGVVGPKLFIYNGLINTFNRNHFKSSFQIY